MLLTHRKKFFKNLLIQQKKLNLVKIITFPKSTLTLILQRMFLLEIMRVYLII